MATAGSVLRGAWGHRAWTAVDERLGLSGLAYPVPKHANRIGYILGGITFFGMLIRFGTGIWLAQFYHPVPEAARQSIAYIIGDAPLGDVIRGVHYWTANVVMVTVLLHLARVYWTGAYKRPREANWLIGLGLLATTLGLLFTGTVLKWDQEGYEALGHNLEMANLLGVFGFWFSADFAVEFPILGRLYMAHVVILPTAGTLLLIGHFLLVKRHGISALPADADRAVDGGPAPATGGSSFAAHLVRMAGFGLILLGAALAISLVLSAPLGPRPVPGIEETKPPWMFLPLYPLEDWFGLAALLWAPVAGFAALALVPFGDRSPYRSPRRRPIWIALGMLVVSLLGALLVYAMLTVPQAHIRDAM
ncbi:MAG: hypothetical protein A2X23_04995 [Chloroflexi bacterium GWC2_73_18]|nr:MAG: hypothetical protein A2X23_04995 [Chloroflexi bacterium GWC2_73_18]